MELNDDNFVMIAYKYYDNPSCEGITEFLEDIKKFKYLQKLFKKKLDNKKFNIKLTLNHIITVYNIFGIKATEMLFFKIDTKYWSYLMSFVVFLNCMPERITINGIVYTMNDIPSDEPILKELNLL